MNICWSYYSCLGQFGSRFIRTHFIFSILYFYMKSEILIDAYRNLTNRVNCENFMLERDYLQRKFLIIITINKLVNRKSKITEILFFWKLKEK